VPELGLVVGVGITGLAAATDVANKGTLHQMREDDVAHVFDSRVASLYV